jgi:threonine dehydratase
MTKRSREPRATPLEPAPDGLVPGRNVLLKREDVHELGAFKWRGALPVLESYRVAGADTVVTASTGNHGAATAWAARRLGMQAVVYAPAESTEAKVALIRELGAEVHLGGDDLDLAKEEGQRWAKEHGLPFFEDGAEPEQFRAYGSIADEILDELGDAPGAVVVPVGNGALFGGIGLRVCERAPDTQRIGVAAKEAPVMAQSWEAGHVVQSERSATFADGLAVRVAIPLAVDVLGEVASRMLVVSEREIARSLGALAEAGMRAEGAAAAALAAIPQLDDVDDPLVLVITGRNIDDELFTRARTHPESFPD